MQWVDNTLDIRKTLTILFEPDDQFEFDVVDSARELQALINQRAAQGAHGSPGCRLLLALVETEFGRQPRRRREGRRLGDAVERQGTGGNPG